MKCVQKRQFSIGITVEGREKLMNELETQRTAFFGRVEIVTLVIIRGK
jgi:hypothetical protein